MTKEEVSRFFDDLIHSSRINLRPINLQSDASFSGLLLKTRVTELSPYRELMIFDNGLSVELDKIQWVAYS